MILWLCGIQLHKNNIYFFHNNYILIGLAMTYCLGIKLTNATIMISDSRTNAGVDNISSYSKMWRYGIPGDRQFILCSAGNLATTQAVITKLEDDIKSMNTPNLTTVVDVKSAAEYIGKVSIETQEKAGGEGIFEASFLLAGEVNGAENVLYLIYPQGNFISTSTGTPFLQIGEVKYGKPILDRVIKKQTTIEQAVTCGLLSMDATMKSNLTVGPPIELGVLEAQSLQEAKYRFFDEGDPYIQQLHNHWDSAMVKAVSEMPSLIW